MGWVVLHGSVVHVDVHGEGMLWVTTDLPWQMWSVRICGVHVASFPGFPRFCSSVCVQYNTWKWKRGRPGNEARMHLQC